MKKKVLLTGASGFIGRHTIPLLLKNGYEVHAVTSQTTNCLPSSVFKHQRNLLDPAQVTELIKEVSPTHLLHFAWYVISGKCWTSTINLDWVSASLHLLQEFAAHGGQRVVFSGTCAEYDWNKGSCNETATPLTPNTLYGTCKANLFQMMNAYSKQVSLSSAWGRIFFSYGPFEYTERLVPSVIQSLLKREVAKCSHGNQIRDFLYVEDVADAFVSLLDSTVQGSVNIASGQEIPLRKIIDQIALKLDAKHLIYYGALPSSANDVPQITADTHKLFHELKWRPKFSLEEGLDRTIDWWKKKNNNS